MRHGLVATLQPTTSVVLGCTQILSWRITATQMLDQPCRSQHIYIWTPIDNWRREGLMHRLDHLSVPEAESLDVSPIPHLIWSAQDCKSNATKLQLWGSDRAADGLAKLIRSEGRDVPRSAPLQERAFMALVVCANSTNAIRVECCQSPSRRIFATGPGKHNAQL